MSWIMIDVEADGPIPHKFSMISFGAVIVENSSQTFYGKLKPISELWIPEALAISGHSREETLNFDDPTIVMNSFSDWIKEFSQGSPRFISDNNGFDWQFINYYFHTFTNSNPFGFSSTNLGSLYKGMVKDMRKNFKHLRKTKHTHHPVQDSLGNCEAFLTMLKQFS